MQFEKRHFEVAASLEAFLGIIVLLGTIPLVQASVGNGNLSLFPPNSKPYGLSLGEWAMKWHIWLYSMPASINAATDTTGKDCGQKQSGPVWFLAGTTGGMVTRTCVIPTGKALLFPLIASECSYAENPNLSTQSQLVKCATDPDNGVTHLELTIDGIGMQGLENYRAQSPLFNLVFPGDNIAGVKAGPTQGVADGFWVMVPPLSVGNHTVHFKAVALQYTTTAAATSFVIDTTYHLLVQ